MSTSNITLAGVLRRVFDEGPYSRGEWAEMLDVSTAALSQWVNGRQIPTPRNLRWLYDSTMETDGMPEDVRAALVDVFRRPLRQVLSSVKANMGTTLANYVQRAETEEAMRSLMSLPADDQRRIVAVVGEACRAVLARSPTPPFQRARRLLDDEHADTWVFGTRKAA